MDGPHQLRPPAQAQDQHLGLGQRAANLLCLVAAGHGKHPLPLLPQPAGHPRRAQPVGIRLQHADELHAAAQVRPRIAVVLHQLRQIDLRPAAGNRLFIG